jgi:uncharacterized membrane protein
MQIHYYFLWFMLYSFVGWFYESTICSIPKHHKFINRGYLLGPYCPIYGFGAVMNLILLNRVESAIGIFILAMITSAIVEYITSYAMEKLFYARWWDYSHHPLNIQGRICLYGCLVFGVANVFLIKVAHPFVVSLTVGISTNAIQISSIGLFLVLLFDTVFTTVHINSLNDKFKNIHEDVTIRVNESLANITDKRKDFQKTLKAITSVRIKLPTIKKQFKWSELRILHAFPKFKSTRYETIVDKIKELIE